MRITCPKCQAHYNVSEDAVAQAALLECSRCHNQWQIETDPAPAVGPPAATATPHPGREIDSLLAEFERDRVFATPHRRGRSGFWIILALLILIAAALLFGWTYLSKPALFDRITSQLSGWIPEAAAPSSAQPVPLGADEPALQLANPAAPSLPIVNRAYRVTTAQDGSRQLILSGAVINNTAELIMPEAMAVELKSESGRTLREWRFAITNRPLSPGQSVDFENITPFDEVGKVAVRVGWPQNFERTVSTEN